MKHILDNPEFRKQLFEALIHIICNPKKHIEVTETPHRAPRQLVQQRAAKL